MTSTDILDFSPSGHLVAVHGNAVASTDNHKFGTGSLKSEDTDGETYLVVPASSDWYFGTNDFTIEMWVMVSENTGSTLLDVIKNDDNEFQLNITPTGSIRFGAKIGASPKAIFYTADGVFLVGEWQHIAIVRNGANSYIFLNGISQTLTIDFGFDANIVGIADADMTIGTYVGGFIDELRISNLARYNSGFTVQTEQFFPDSDTILLLHFNVNTAWDFDTPIWYEHSDRYPTFGGDVMADAGTARKAIRYINGLLLYAGQEVSIITEDGALANQTISNDTIDLGDYYYSVTLTLVPAAAETPKEVPLVYDTLTGTWIAKLSRVNQEDREVGIDVAKKSMDDQRFLSSIGFITE